MKKTYFYTEISYVCGIIGLALGTALMAKADFGVSMVVAPSYLLYLKLSQMWDFVTFGLTEYIMQALLLLCIIMIRKKFKFYFL
ncbi:MAG TPA: hypothetical protein DER23_02065, partial [Clostridiales bacterium]|nr:hypothetical protein [Clostridiales bacterium]